MADEAEDELNHHELALGGTRPAMIPGLNMPIVDFSVWIMAATEAFMFRWPLLIPIVVGFLASLRMYRKDYNAGRVLLSWAFTAGRHFSGEGNFVTPRPGRGYYGIIPRHSRRARI
jgi:type IV secretory pathway VirB3-like protein